jgi:4-hydroxybenzoate polyprenyltransferase
MRLSVLTNLVLIEQTLFGLPWVLTGAILPFAMPGFIETFPWHNWVLWIWIVFAFIGARTAGMSLNRLIDREIDQANPRTRNRALPKGETTPFQVSMLAWLSIFLFIFSCAMINPLCFTLSPVVVLLLWAYSYTKRFTPFCHLFLGLIQFFGPFFAWIAITGTWGLPPVLLGAALMTSITANDIIYTLQDLEFDRNHQLHSIPAALGIDRSLLVARILHILTVLLLTGLGLLLRLNIVYYIGVAVIAYLYYYQHTQLNPRDSSRIDDSFSRCNTLVAVTLLVFSVGDVLCSVLL